MWGNRLFMNFYQWEISWQAKVGRRRKESNPWRDRIEAIDTVIVRRGHFEVRLKLQVYGSLGTSNPDLVHNGSMAEKNDKWTDEWTIEHVQSTIRLSACMQICKNTTKILFVIRKTYVKYNLQYFASTVLFAETKYTTFCTQKKQAVSQNSGWAKARIEPVSLKQ